MAYKHYSEDEKAVAISYLKACGYPDKPGALKDASRHTTVSTRQLMRWYRGENTPPPDNLVIQKTFDLSTAITEELEKLFGSLEDARDEASYKDLATAAGILIDKRQLLTNGPTANINHMVNALTDDERRHRMKELALAIVDELQNES